jgi:hypothetical protein
LNMTRNYDWCDRAHSKAWRPTRVTSRAAAREGKKTDAGIMTSHPETNATTAARSPETESLTPETAAQSSDIPIQSDDSEGSEKFDPSPSSFWSLRHRVHPTPQTPLWSYHRPGLYYWDARLVNEGDGLPATCQFELSITEIWCNERPQSWDEALRRLIWPCNVLQGWIMTVRSWSSQCSYGICPWAEDLTPPGRWILREAQGPQEWRFLVLLRWVRPDASSFGLSVVTAQPFESVFEIVARFHLEKNWFQKWEMQLKRRCVVANWITMFSPRSDSELWIKQQLLDWNALAPQFKIPGSSLIFETSLHSGRALTFIEDFFQRKTDLSLEMWSGVTETGRQFCTGMGNNWFSTATHFPMADEDWGKQLFKMGWFYVRHSIPSKVSISPNQSPVNWLISRHRLGSLVCILLCLMPAVDDSLNPFGDRGELLHSDQNFNPASFSSQIWTSHIFALHRRRSNVRRKQRLIFWLVD